MATSASETVGKRIIDFLTKSTDPFHAVAEVSQRLKSNGFIHMSEQSIWNGDSIKEGGKYFVTRNGSCLCAFVVGSKYKPGNGIKMVSAHTDSPCPKLKPATKIQREGCHQIGVQPYGGGIWNTWFDRTLALSGRVLTALKDGSGLQEHLVKIHEPLMVIPNLCIHLDRANHENFAPNKEKHFVPIISTIETHSLLQPQSVGSAGSENSEHSPVLMKLLADRLGVEENEIQDFELSLYDFQDPCLGGAYGEFILAARQDNLISCFIATEALINSDSSVEEEEMIRMILLYDNEEVGSQSYQGALSRFTESILRRSVEVLTLRSGENSGNIENVLDASLAKSYHISSDAAHYVHPNYPEKHEANLKPIMNKGPVVKVNFNQRYATNSRGMSLMKYLADKACIPIQKVAVRNDSPCGTTVGPLVSSTLGIETVDIGVGIFSMHSIRETGCVKDVLYGQQLLESFFGERLPHILSEYS